ncbi:MAG: ABC transporter permease [Arcobacteraceae bacterium]
MENICDNFKLSHTQNAIELHLFGSWSKESLICIIKKLSLLNITNSTSLTIDFSKLSQCDSSAMIYLIGFIKQFNTSLVTLTHLGKFEAFYNLYCTYYTTKPSLTVKKESLWFLTAVGIKVHWLYESILNAINFIGELVYFIVISFLNPKTIRFKAMLNHIERSAIQALFIVGITSFLVGIVIAYQGSVQLNKFGANIFIVEMVCITMFREIAPLMTAIVIAGRTASSYTAEIGAMKITEEIDAMKTMGFEPTIFLTLPRIFALIISLPLLIFFSDIVSVFAGSVVAYLDLNVSFAEFINRMKDTVELKHFLIGIFKGIFFGIAIAAIGCYHGFQVKNNTTSIGKYTTISVVNAIFVVIALNAIFSVILTQSGI